MHELSLCRTIIEIIQDHLSGIESPRVTKIVLEIGELAAVDEVALRFSFDAVAKNTVAHGAILDIILVEGQAMCAVCQKGFRLRRYYDACPRCGNASLSVMRGDELRVKSMEVL